MKVGIIAPIKFLERYCITDIQYCLPGLLVDSTDYKEFYRERKKRGNTIILDCKRISWKREPEYFETVEAALSLIEPDIVIAPSFMFNPKDSLDVYKKFASRFPSHTSKIIRCLEGTSEEDVTNFPAKKAFAIPSHMYRYTSTAKSNHQVIYVENHLTVEELEGKDGIIVTSLPVRLGLQGRLLADIRPTPDSLTFYEEEDNFPTIAMRNVEDTIEYYTEE